MPPQIAVVEDEVLISKYLERCLESLGYTVLWVATNGRDALERFEASRPDLVLMDISLEGEMDGIETAARVRTAFQTPVVFLTSHTDEATIRRAKQVSAFGYIAKPFAKRELHAALQIALQRSSVEAEIERQRKWLGAVLHCITDAVIVVDADRQVRFMNPAGEAMTGMTEAEAMNQSLGDVLRLGHDSAGAAWCANVSTGSQTPVEVSESPLESGGVSGVVIALHDLTEARAAREALERLGTIVASSDDAILGFDRYGAVTHSNHAAEALFGADLELAIPPEVLEAARRGETVRNHQLSLQRPDGDLWFLSVSAAPIRDAAGAVTGVSCVARDNTERMKSRREIMRINESLRQLSGDLLRMQDAERRRIARELHDSTAQMMTALSLQLSRLEREQLSPAKRRKLVADGVDLAQACARELRSLSYLLHPPLLDDLGLASALRTFIDGYGERTRIRVRFEVVEELGRFDPDMESAVFRIVQEALTNIHKHAHGTEALVRLNQNSESVSVEIIDNGRGLQRKLTEERQQLGVGVLGMRERARQLSGELELFDHGGGVTVRATFPIRKAQAG